MQIGHRQSPRVDHELHKASRRRVEGGPVTTGAETPRTTSPLPSRQRTAAPLATICWCWAQIAGGQPLAVRDHVDAAVVGHRKGSCRCDGGSRYWPVTRS
jgi:hypothetical protein